MKRSTAELRDFTVSGRTWFILLAAMGIGVGAAALAVVLLRGIAVATNLFYYHRLSMAAVGPAGSDEPFWLLLFIPVIGGLLVGALAYYGTDKIRGHGIPEALEAILMRGARVEPKVAVLKPLSAAIAIGSGGPFGAEGPIIMTGGAFGSLVAQCLHLTDAERTTLLVAGAAAGMSATFAAPLAAIFLAVELLLFEWRPRSLVPVAMASILAGFLRVYWLGAGPVFPVSLPAGMHLETMLLAGPLGALVGLAAAGLSRLMYGLEDGFESICTRIGVHWAWWPAIGGVGVGIGGLFFPRGLGVGYDNIAELLRGNAPLALLAGVLIGKSLMWAFSLSSGTSGGVLAPLLMIGAALGEIAAQVLQLPTASQALWALMGMGAMLAGALGVPLTAIVFSLELTHALPALLPLALACMLSYFMTTLVMPRSIITEKLSRRGHHLSREYGVDPLEMLRIADVMIPSAGAEQAADAEISLAHSVYADELCRPIADRMALLGVSQLPVVDRRSGALCGVVGASQFLAGRKQIALRESHLSKALRRKGEGPRRSFARQDPDCS